MILDTIYDSQGGLAVSTGANTNFYPSYDSTDPYATKERGYYFTGNSYMNIAANSITFAPIFTIYAWINPGVVSAAIFSKQDSVNNNILTFKIYSSALSVVIGSTTYTGSNTITTSA